MFLPRISVERRAEGPDRRPNSLARLRGGLEEREAEVEATLAYTKPTTALEEVEYFLFNDCHRPPQRSACGVE